MALVAKAAIVSAIILFLSLGLCGVAVFAGQRLPGQIGVTAFVGMGLGIVGLLLSALAAIIVAIVTAVRGNNSER